MQLREYLDANDVDLREFSQLIGVRAQTVYRYISGERIPSKEVMGRIKAATNGAVEPNDFYAAAA